MSLSSWQAIAIIVVAVVVIYYFYNSKTSSQQTIEPSLQQSQQASSQLSASKNISIVSQTNNPRIPETPSPSIAAYYNSPMVTLVPTIAPTRAPTQVPEKATPTPSIAAYDNSPMTTLAPTTQPPTQASTTQLPFVQKPLLYCYNRDIIKDGGRGWIFDESKVTQNLEKPPYSQIIMNPIKKCNDGKLAFCEDKSQPTCMFDDILRCDDGKPAVCEDKSKPACRDRVSCEDKEFGTSYSYGQCIDCDYPGSAGYICGGDKMTNKEVVDYCRNKLQGTTNNIIRPF